MDQPPYPPQSGLMADLYELTMAAGYLETRFEARATFELFVRELPPRRNFLVAAGLEQALDFLEHVRFGASEIAYLRELPAFSRIGPNFFDYLAAFRFSGDVMAMPEGTVCFPGEPLLRVSAPIAEAQIVETALLATVSFQTMVASKAARLVEAAGGRPVVEFGARRAHGIESGMLAARAAFIGGCLGTSHVKAGQCFGIPTYGTQAHSWIMAHENEEEAFAHFLDLFPRHSVLLLDTYDVRSAIEKVLALARKPRGVRLDSGDLTADSIWVRHRLDEAGWGDVEIFVSGDLEEDRITALLAAGATSVYACASHAVLSGPAIDRIANSKLEQVVVTNTIPLRDAAQKLTVASADAPNKLPKIKVLSIAGLLGAAIESIHMETSVSTLFS